MRSMKATSIRSLSLAMGAFLGACAGCGAFIKDRPDQAGSVEADCAGVPAREREQGLLAYRDAIAGSRPLVQETLIGKLRVSSNRGTIISLRAEPNLSVPWLRRVNACHADLAAGGQLASSASGDPFLVPGTTVTIEETQTGFAARVEGTSDRELTEIKQRIAALGVGPSVAAVQRAGR